MCTRSIGAAAALRCSFEITGDVAQLGVQVLPLADPQEVQVLLATHPPERVAGQGSLLAAQVVPEPQVRLEVAAVRVGRVGLVLRVVRGLRPFVASSAARDPHPRRRRPSAPRTAGAAPRPCPAPRPDARADPGWTCPATMIMISAGSRAAPRPAASGPSGGRPGSGPAGGRCAVSVGRSPSPRRQRPELAQQPQTVVDLAGVRRLDEREGGDRAQVGGGHLQDHRGQVGAQDLRLGELRPAEEVLLVVQPDADPGRDPAAATGALVGRGLGDRLDRQPLHLRPGGVARDPRGAGSTT